MIKQTQYYYLLVLALLAAGWSTSLNITYAACNSGPDFCTNDPRIPGALAAKKNQLTKEYPIRLVSLLDRGTQCIARIERSPDAFTMVIIRPGTLIETILWTQANEDAGNSEIATGTVLRFWIVNARRSFSCDGQKPYNQQKNYNAAGDINTTLAIRCGKSGKCVFKN